MRQRTVRTWKVRTQRKVFKGKILPSFSSTSLLSSSSMCRLLRALVLPMSTHKPNVWLLVLRVQREVFMDSARRRDHSGQLRNHKQTPRTGVVANFENGSIQIWTLRSTGGLATTNHKRMSCEHLAEIDLAQNTSPGEFFFVPPCIGRI